MASDPSSPGSSVKGYHVLKVDGYSRTFYNHNNCANCRSFGPSRLFLKKHNNYCECNAPLFESGSFCVGGHTWMICYCPRGTYWGLQDFISIYLYLADDVVDEPVKVRATFSILDHDLKSKNRYTRTPTTVTFSKPGDSHGIWIARRELTKRRLQQDCFAIRVDLFIIREEKPSLSVELPPSEMSHHIGALLSRQEHVDVEFRVGRETFVAHRLLLGARSPASKADLFGDDRETKTVIQVDDMEPQVFKAPLSFIYTDTLPKVALKKEPAMSQCLLVAADRYGLQKLKSMCEYRLGNHIDLNSVEDILLLAEKHQCAALKEACFDFIGSTATLLTARENIFALRSTQEPRFDHLVSLCPTVTKDQIFNFFDESDRESAIRGVEITLDIE